MGPFSLHYEWDGEGTVRILPAPSAEAPVHEANVAVLLMPNAQHKTLARHNADPGLAEAIDAAVSEVAGHLERLSERPTSQPGPADVA